MAKRVRTTRRLEVWLKDTSVALFVLNANRRLVFFNAGCQQLTGWTPPDVLGQVCEFVTEADSNSSAALLASLTPPSNVWQGETITVPASVSHRERDPVASHIHFFPLTDVDRKVQAALGIIQPPMANVPSAGVSISQRLHTELAALRASVRQQVGEGSLIGRSPGMQRVLGQLRLAQQSSVPVLFLGEVGTGREQMGRLIHDASDRGRTSFVPLDCRQLTSQHLESTFRRILESSHANDFQPGTIYLNHVDALPRDLQRLVLNVIELKRPASPRVMAAAQNPLDRLIESDEFLAELHFALTTIVISIPSLRSRPEDLEPIAQFFLEELNRGQPHQITGFHDDVWQQLRRYNWPGNVGELRAVVTEARTACSGPEIEPIHLPFRFRTGVSGQTIGPATRKRSEALDPLLLRVEREQIELALSEARHNKAKAAELLGITRPRLYRRMEVLGIIDNDSGSLDEPYQSAD
jgi:DNA-binding NtrC family response regulator